MVENRNIIGSRLTSQEGPEMVKNSNIKVHSVINQGATDEWTPPNDWINIRDVANNEIHLLVGDFVPFIAFSVTVTGGYTVDWGDGSSAENFASGVIATHTYTVGNGTPCSRGYTTYKIRIYAQIPANSITNFKIDNPNTISGSIQHMYNSLLWACFGTTGLASLAYAFYDTFDPIYISAYLEAIELPDNLTSCSNFSYMAYNCYALQYVKMPMNYSNANINFEQTFTNCYKLPKINYNATTLAVSSFYQTHAYNYSLRTANLPTTVNNCTNWSQVFYFCYSLTEFTAPNINTNCDCSNMFSYNYAIRKVTFNATWNGRITQLISMFTDCRNLEELTFPSTVNSMVTMFASFLSHCYKLKSFTFPSGHGTITNIQNIFQTNFLLETVTNFPALTSVSVMSNAFAYAVRLKNISNLDQLGDTTSNFDLSGTYAGMYSIESLSIRNKITGRFVLTGMNTNLRAKLNSLRFTNAASTFAGGSPQIDIQYCSLDATALNQVFTDLPTLTGKTIRITGNPGATTCDTSIATAKGWTVTT